MDRHAIVSREAWIEARQRFLAREKEFTRLRDELSRERRELPWERVEKRYVFEGSNGEKTLADLFGAQSQLVVYHFMYGPNWESPCKSCSFWADNFERIDVHLRHRDVSLVAASRAPYPMLAAFQRRMGWTFEWVSSCGSDFNYDYQVSFRAEDLARGEVFHNYRPRETAMSDLAGISVFYRDEGGSIFHTYSTYERGLDMLNGAYHYLDLVPKGRDEDQLSYTMSWLRLRDSYEG